MLAGLKRRWRRAIAQLDRPQRSRSDRAAWQKFRVQTAVLQGRAGVRPAALGRAVVQLAQRGVPVTWVHGAFDAVCPPDNSRRWAALGMRHGGAVQLHLTLAGHLGHEPATRDEQVLRPRQQAGAIALAAADRAGRATKALARSADSRSENTPTLRDASGT